MSVTADKLPTERTILSAIDVQAKRTAQSAQQSVAAIVTSQTPRKSGKLTAALRPKVSRTATGVALSVSPPRGKNHSGQATIADVVRWVTRGTGIYRAGGGPKAPIRGRRVGFKRGAMSVYGRPYRSVKGQHPNPFMRNIAHLGTLRVERAFAQGARDAGRAVERVL